MFLFFISWPGGIIAHDCEANTTNVRFFFFFFEKHVGERSFLESKVHVKYCLQGVQDFPSSS